MYTQKLEVRIEKKYQFKDNIVIDINEMPYPTAIFIPSVKEVILNNLAYKILGMEVSELFDLAAWRRINPPYLEDEVKKD